MIVEPEHLRSELERACVDAGLDPGAFAVWIVDAARPPAATPIAYLQPAGRVRSDTVLVFRAVGEERAAAFTAHRLAVWRELPGLPDAALGPMVRHELEHARRWERSGPAFYDADERLRAQFGAESYAALPTEREANAAAAAYARRALAAGSLEELRRHPELAEMLEAEQPPDVVATTLALLGEQVAVGPAAVTPNGLTIELVSPA